MFLLTGYEGFGDGLADGINLGDVITFLHSDSDVHSRKLLLAQKQKKLQ